MPLAIDRSHDVLLFSDRTVDLVRGEVRGVDGVVALTPRELALLVYLFRREEQVVSRDTLLVEVWGHPPDSLSRAVDLAVRRLRTKLEASPRQPHHLLTVFGEGYRLVGAQHALPQHSLPAELDRMFGREALLDSLAETTERAIVLTGPFGAGKTRLAASLGRRRHPTFRGGVWWVPLSDARSASDVTAAAIRVLRLGDVSLVDGLLARGPTLLILDNFEQLPPEADALVAGWLEAAPGLSVVVTSRRGVAVPGARRIAVPPLSTPAATALLRDRARAAGRVLTEDALCTALVERLDGQPLAIELAAVQTRMLSLPVLLERLGDAVFRGRLEAIFRAVEATLSPEARAVLGACAMFAGGFTAEAVEAVIGQPVIAALGELSEHSLVLTRSTTTGVRLALLESVRDLTLARLASEGGAQTARLAHARWAGSLGLRLAEEIERFGRSPDWALLDAERDNLLAAWRHSEDDLNLRRQLLRGLGPVLGEIPEAPTMLRDALSGAMPDAERGALRLLQARLLRIRGQLSEAEEVLSDARAQLPPGSLEHRAARLTEALMFIDRGEYEAADVRLVPLCDTEPPDAITGSALIHRSRVLRGLGDVAGGRRAGLEGLDILRDLSARRLLATAYGILSDQQGSRGPTSLGYLREALHIHREEGNLRGEAVALSNLVNALADEEAWDEVWPLAEQARAAHQALGARRSEGVLLSNLCGIALSCWQIDRAVAWGQQAVRICRASGVSFFEAQALLNLGIAALTEHRAADAVASLEQARALYARLDNTVMRLVTDGVLAAAEAGMDNIEAARTRLDSVYADDALQQRPMLHACVNLQEGFLDLALARRGDSEAHRAAAEGRITGLRCADGTLPPNLDTTEVRGMIRLLNEAIEAAEA